MGADRVNAAVVGGNAAALAFLKDGRADGYSFVIPRRHVPTLLGLERGEAHGVMDLLIDVARSLEAELAPDGINVVQNTGVAGDQTVPHAHFHLIPRRAGDEWTPPAGERWTGRLAPLHERLELAARLGDRLRKPR